MAAASVRSRRAAVGLVAGVQFVGPFGMPGASPAETRGIFACGATLGGDVMTTDVDLPPLEDQMRGLLLW